MTEKIPLANEQLANIVKNNVLGIPVGSRELDLVSLMGPLQLKTFYDSMKSCQVFSIKYQDLQLRMQQTTVP